MFWKRTTGHGAFTGLLCGTTAAAFTWCLTVAEGKGGVLGTLHTFPSAMAQNFWIAIIAWTVCFVLTAAISLVTKPATDEQLKGLVFGLTEMPKDTEKQWYLRPGPLAVAVSIFTVVLNVIFW